MKIYEELKISLILLQTEDIVRTSPTKENDNDLNVPDFPETMFG